MPHIHERIDFAVETFIVHNNKVLLRKHDKYKIWLAVGGHIELGEDPNEAALREVQEEVGLEVTLIGDVPHFSDEGQEYRELLAPRYLNRHRINETHEHIAFIYFAISKTDVLTLSATEQSEECRWFTAAELDDPSFGIRQSIIFYAHEALKACKS